MAKEGVGQVYCLWYEPLEPLACLAHNYEEGLIYLVHKAGTEVCSSMASPLPCHTVRQSLTTCTLLMLVDWGVNQAFFLFIVATYCLSTVCCYSLSF